MDGQQERLQGKPRGFQGQVEDSWGQSAEGSETQLGDLRGGEALTSRGQSPTPCFRFALGLIIASDDPSFDPTEDAHSHCFAPEH